MLRNLTEVTVGRCFSRGCVNAVKIIVLIRLVEESFFCLMAPSNSQNIHVHFYSDLFLESKFQILSKQVYDI